MVERWGVLLSLPGLGGDTRLVRDGKQVAEWPTREAAVAWIKAKREAAPRHGALGLNCYPVNLDNPLP